MTEELTYETIPNEYWPKCDWCGADIDQMTEHYPDEGKPLRLCQRCSSYVSDMIWGYVHEVLRAFFESHALDQYNRHLKSKWSYREALDIAVQNMKEAQRS